MDIQIVEGTAHHPGVGFADEEGAYAAGCFDEGRHRAAGGYQPTLRRSGWIRVGGDKARAIGYQPDGFGDERQVVAVGLTQHHVIGVVVGDDVADAMDGLGQPALADDKGRAVGFLRLQEASGGHGRGENALDGDVETDRLQSVRQIARRVDRVVGQHQVFHSTGFELFDEPVCSGDEGAPADEHPVHVNQIAFRWFRSHSVNLSCGFESGSFEQS